MGCFQSVYMHFFFIKATKTGKILFLGPQAVALNISLLGHCSTKISTASEINEDLHDGV